LGGSYIPTREGGTEPFRQGNPSGRNFTEIDLAEVWIGTSDSTLRTRGGITPERVRKIRISATFGAKIVMGVKRINLKGVSPRGTLKGEEGGRRPGEAQPLEGRTRSESYPNDKRDWKHREREDSKKTIERRGALAGGRFQLKRGGKKKNL